VVTMMPTTITARAPAKVILLGEHAVNRGEAALAVSLGLYSRCTLTLDASASGYLFCCEGQQEHTDVTTREALLDFARALDQARSQSDLVAIQQAVADDFFAAAKYVLAAAGELLPASLVITTRSEIPPSAGLGSGGSVFVSLAAALAQLLGLNPSSHLLAEWAVRGDILAHGGTASGLDTQTSLYGGAIRYTSERQGEPVPYDERLALVVGHTRISAATSEVNARVRAWLAERPSRLHYFREIGLLVRLAEEHLRAGDWPALGHLLNLNQLLLERIGVSCPELERLIEAALEAGALGAKLAGSGGGGVMFALVTPATMQAVAQAISAAGGQTIIAPVGVRGVSVETVG
jgi:mevalonate kinase